MPYICLARGDIPDGVIQVLDLLPNSSQWIPSLMPPGESRYVNRVKRGTAGISATGLLGAVDHVDGLEAYLLDRVEPGGLEVAGGTIAPLATVAANDTIVIAGVTFTAKAAPNVAIGEFQDAVTTSVAACAASLVLAINDTTAGTGGRTLIKANTTNGKPVNVYPLATVPVAGTVVLAAASGDVPLVGYTGTMTLVAGAPARWTLSGDRTTRTHETWTPAVQDATADALIARLDAGLPLTLSDINTVLLAQAGAELTVAGGSQSIGTVAGILDVLSGRTFRAPVKDTTGRAAAADVNSGVYRYMDATYPTFKWHSTAGRGGFTQLVLSNGGGMSDGEIKPSTIGGDTENREVGGVRHTYNVDALTASLVVGQLSKMTASTLLWPSTNIFPHFPFGQAGFTEYDPATAPRLVTVYDDDGTVL